jgi:hypothetical protein
VAPFLQVGIRVMGGRRCSRGMAAQAVGWGVGGVGVLFGELALLATPAPHTLPSLLPLCLVSPPSERALLLLSSKHPASRTCGDPAAGYGDVSVSTGHHLIGRTVG